ncbi:J domain-containing protein [Aspergillus undulatus]|uniref:J domain-containing protein n=1 Tax=Aspergillus undulatus TaxID=1810928 RepID=UPI003CCCF057
MAPRSMVDEIEGEAGKTVSTFCRTHEEREVSKTPVRLQNTHEIKAHMRFSAPSMLADIWKLENSPYEILGIPESERSDLTPAQLSRRYRQKVLQVHPDRQFAHEQGADENVEEDPAARFHEVHEAYELLRDSVKKRTI